MYIHMFGTHTSTHTHTHAQTLHSPRPPKVPASFDTNATSTLARFAPLLFLASAQTTRPLLY